MKNEIRTDLRLVKTYVNDMLMDLDNLSIGKADVDVIHKLYSVAIEAKNQLVYGNNLPF